MPAYNVPVRDPSLGNPFTAPQPAAPQAWTPQTLAQPAEPVPAESAPADPLFDADGVPNVSRYLAPFSGLSRAGQAEKVQEAFEYANAREPGRFSREAFVTAANKNNGISVALDGDVFVGGKTQSGTLRDVASAAAGSVTGLADSIAGLFNLAVDNGFSQTIAKGAHELNEGAQHIASEERQEFSKRASELFNEGRIADGIGHYLTHPLMTLESAFEAIGPSLGAGMLVKGAAKAAGKTVGAKTTLGLSAGLTGGGGTAQELGEKYGDYDLKSGDAARVALSAASNAAMGLLSAKFGGSPEAVLLRLGDGATRAKVSDSLAKTVIRAGLVEGSTEADAALTDAIIVDGTDKDGNFDMSAVNMDRVLGQAAQAGVLGAVGGGAPAAVTSAKGAAQARKTARPLLDAERFRAEQETLKGAYDAAVAAGDEQAVTDAVAQLEQHTQTALDTAMQANEARLELAARTFRPKVRKQYEQTVASQEALTESLLKDANQWYKDNEQYLSADARIEAMRLVKAQQAAEGGASPEQAPPAAQAQQAQALAAQVIQAAKQTQPSEAASRAALREQAANEAPTSAARDTLNSLAPDVAQEVARLAMLDTLADQAQAKAQAQLASAAEWDGMTDLVPGDASIATAARENADKAREQATYYEAQARDYEKAADSQRADPLLAEAGDFTTAYAAAVPAARAVIASDLASGEMPAATDVLKGVRRPATQAAQREASALVSALERDEDRVPWRALKRARILSDKLLADNGQANYDLVLKGMEQSGVIDAKSAVDYLVALQRTLAGNPAVSDTARAVTATLLNTFLEAHPHLAPAETSLPAGELDGAFRDTTLGRDTPDVRTRLQAGDIVGALRAVKENGYTHPVAAQLVRQYSHAEVAARVVLEDGAFEAGGVFVNAAYDPASHTIRINTQVAATPYYLMHELTHHLTADLLSSRTGRGEDGELEAVTRSGRRLTGTQREAFERLNTLFGVFREMVVPEGLLHAQASVDEFVGEAFSNPQMQAWLAANELAVKDLLDREYVARASREQRSMFRAFVTAVRKLLGIPDGQASALTDVIGLTNILTGLVDTVPSSAQSEMELAGSMVLAKALPDSTQYEERGTLRSLPSGEWELRIDGLPAVVYDTQAEALLVAWDTDGLTPKNISASTVPVRNQNLLRSDLLNPRYARARVQLLSLLGNSPLAQATVDRLLERVENAWLWATSAFIDSNDVFRTIDTIAARMGVQTTLYRDVVARTNEARAASGRPDSEGVVLQQQLITGLKTIGSSLEELDNFAYAHRELELAAQYRDARVAGVEGAKRDGLGAFEWNGLRGVAAARAFLASLTKTQQGKLESVMTPLRQANQRMLKRELDARIIDEALYKKLLNSKMYVPLLSKGTRGLSRLARVQGRSTMADSPVSNMLAQLERRSSRILRNDSLRDLYHTANALGLGEIITLDTTDPVFDVDGELDMQRNQKYNDPDSVWVHLEDGKLGQIHINTSTRTGKNLLQALRRDALGPVLSACRWATSLTAAGKTAYNPSFLAITPLWDATMVMINFAGAYDPAMSVADNYRLGYKSVRDAVRLLPQVMSARLSGTSDLPSYRLFSRIGGGTNIGSHTQVDTVKKSLSLNAQASPLDIIQAQGAKGAADALLSANQRYISAVHSVGEAFRYASFVNYLSHATGRDMTQLTQAQMDTWAADPANRDLLLQAAQGSRKIAGDFSQHGADPTMGSLFMFWNAAMQSIPLLASIATNRAGQVGLTVLFAVSVASTLSALGDPDDIDDDGGSRFARSQRRKTSIVLGGADGVAIPAAYEIRPFIIAGQTLALWAAGKLSTADAIGDIFHGLWGSAMPFNTPGDVTSEASFRAVLPSLAQPLMTAMTGTNAFGTSTKATYALDDQGRRVAALAGVETGRAGTPEFMNALSRIAYEYAGVDFSPATADAVMSELAGGWYQVPRALAGDPPMYKQGAGDSAFVQMLTKNFVSVQDPYAVGKAYSTKLAALQSSRRMQGLAETGSYNALTGADEVMRIAAARDKAVASLSYQGKGVKQWQGALLTAKRAGDRAGVEQAQLALRNIDAEKSRLTGAALRQLNAIKE
jgi:hypothetical protein